MTLPRVANPPPGLPRIFPHLIYDDVPGALAWLEKAFGFRERADGRIEGPDGEVAHAEMELDGAVIMLGGPSMHGDSPRKGVSTMVNVYVDDVEAHYERAVAAGATIVIPLQDAIWGDRRYQATDPEGHQWHFAQHVREVPTEDWVGRLKKGEAPGSG